MSWKSFSPMKAMSRHAMEVVVCCGFHANHSGVLKLVDDSQLFVEKLLKS